MASLTSLSVTLTTVLLLLSMGWLQQDLQRGLDAYRAGDYRTAARLLVPAADDAGTDALIALARMYAEGLGVDQDDAAAFYYAQRALATDASSDEARQLARRAAPKVSPAVQESASFWASKQRSRLDPGRLACVSWTGETTTPHEVISFRANASIQQMAEDIVYYSGLQPNFDVVEGNVPNAAAEVAGTRRRVIFNPGFLAQLQQVTGTPWGAYSVMAHEIGHHLQGHTIVPGGSRPGLELQADEFSGFILARMGASLDEARVAMDRLGSPTGSATHPDRASRLQAIGSGFERGRSLDARTADGRPLPPIGTGPGPRPVPAPGPAPGPPPMPIPVPQVASACMTQFGTCQMMVPVPVGSACYCINPAGVFPGIAR